MYTGDTKLSFPNKSIPKTFNTLNFSHLFFSPFWPVFRRMTQTRLALNLHSSTGNGSCHLHHRVQGPLEPVLRQEIEWGVLLGLLIRISFSVAFRFYRTDCMHGDVTRQPSPEDMEWGVWEWGGGGGGEMGASLRSYGRWTECPQINPTRDAWFSWTLLYV